MTNHVVDNDHLLREQSRKAIALAMESRWEEAAAINQSMLAINPTDVDASNRLGKACLELGELDAAGKAFQRTLELAPTSAIARKNLERLERMKGVPAAKSHSQKLAPQLFIEESGKTTQVVLQDPPDSALLVSVSAGMAVELQAKGDNLKVYTPQEQYLGKLPLALGRRLFRLMEGGNRYQAAVFSVKEVQVTVMLREVFQHPAHRGAVSFPTKENALSIPAGALSYDLDEVEGLEQAFPPIWEPDDPDEEMALSVRSPFPAEPGEDDDEEDEGPYPEEIEE